MLRLIKSSCKAAFLFLASMLSLQVVFAQNAVPGADALASIAIEKKLDQSATWAALLHESAGTSRISDPEFILSSPHFSVKRELQLSIAALFYGQNRDAMRCKFPARDYWLRVQLGIAWQPLQGCQGLAEYRSKAPFEEIRLVFASENVDQPSSMMGHVFLKMMGRNAGGELRQHAVTFYTEAETLNIPKLLWQNMTTGMPGFYSMVPFDDALRQYTEKENRSVWEYGLKLDPVSRELIGLHIFELKDVNFKYFFQSYNCANLIDDLLRLASPQKLPGTAWQWWTTPKDVIKRMAANSVIEAVEVTPATWWLLRSLEKRFNAREIQFLREFAEKPTEALWSRFAYGDIQSPAKEFVLQYLNYLHHEGRLTEPEWQERVQVVNRIASGDSYVVAVRKSADPVNAPGDSQFSLGTLDRDGAKYVSLSYLPASHALMDASNGGESETELKLFQFTLLQGVEGRGLTLDKLILYSAQSKVPLDSIVGGNSGGTHIGYQHHASPNQGYQPVFDVTLNRGRTTLLFTDTKAYIDLAGGFAMRDMELFPHVIPSVGLLTERIKGMKTQLSLSAHFNALGHGGAVKRIGLGSRLQFTKELSLLFHWTRSSSSESDRALTATGLDLKLIY